MVGLYELQQAKGYILSYQVHLAVTFGPAVPHRKDVAGMRVAVEEPEL